MMLIRPYLSSDDSGALDKHGSTKKESRQQKTPQGESNLHQIVVTILCHLRPPFP